MEDAEHRARDSISQTVISTSAALSNGWPLPLEQRAPFPLAFEPVFCKAEKGSLAEDNYKEVCHFETAGTSLTAECSIDKPFEAALERLFQMPVGWRVRRVLAYIVPDPGITASEGPDTEELAPTLPPSPWQAVRYPVSGTVGDCQIDQIKVHNRRVRLYRIGNRRIDEDPA